MEAVSWSLPHDNAGGASLNTKCLSCICVQWCLQALFSLYCLYSTFCSYHFSGIQVNETVSFPNSCGSVGFCILYVSAGKVYFRDGNGTLSISNRKRLLSPILSLSHSPGMSLMPVSFRCRFLPLFSLLLVFSFFISCVSLIWSKQSNGWVLGGRDSCCLNFFQHSLLCPGSHSTEGAACNRIMLVPLLS